MTVSDLEVMRVGEIREFPGGGICHSIPARAQVQKEKESMTQIHMEGKKDFRQKR